jgi:hypothetical protein
VPYLRSIALDTIIKNWSEYPHLKELDEKERQKVLDKISENLDLKTALLIEDNSYWKRRCDKNWENINIDEYEGNYRRLFMEKSLQDKLENFVPNQSDYDELDQLVDVVKNDVERVKLEQLLPPVPQLKEEKDEDEEDDEDNSDHLDLELILPKLVFLTKLELSFGVKDVGMNFEWGFFTFTTTDANMLACCLHQCFSLEDLAITKSRLEDEKARMIIKRLLTHPRLKRLDLSHNRLRDKTGRALGKLIKTVETLEELTVEDNEIGAEGATAIAMGLANEMSRLKKLNISQNIIQNEGGIAIARSLSNSKTLTELKIGANGLGAEFAKSLSATLANNTPLLNLNIVSNNIGLEGGQSLSAGLDQNSTLQTLDLRLSGAGLEAEHSISEKLKLNLK